MIPVHVDTSLVLGPCLALSQHFFYDVFIARHPVHRKDVEPAEHEHTHDGPHRLTPVESQTHHHAACHGETERLPGLVFYSRPLAITIDKRVWVQKNVASSSSGYSAFTRSLHQTPSISLFRALRLPPSPAFGSAIFFEQPENSPAPHVA